MTRSAIIIFALASMLSLPGIAQDTCNAWLEFRVSAGTLPPGLILDSGSGVISGTPSTAGTFTFTIEASDGCASTSRQYTVNIALMPPANFTATAVSASTVALSWSAVGGGPSYEVYRSVNNSGYTLLTTTSSTSIQDTSLSANTTYLYKVRSVLNAEASAFSPIDAATTIVFTGDPILAGTPIAAVHLTQLRTAVNAIGVAAGLSPQPYTDPGLGAGSVIQAVHINELRSRLDAARGLIGLPAQPYVDPAISVGVTTVKAAHIANLRTGVK